MSSTPINYAYFNPGMNQTELNKRLKEKNLKLEDKNKNGSYDSEDFFNYTVRKGDTSYSIARDMKIPYKTLVQLNENIKDLTQLKENKTVFKIPLTPELLQELGLHFKKTPAPKTPTTKTPPSKNPPSQNPPTGNGQKVVMLDAGHGQGFDDGAVAGANGEFKEKDINFNAVNILAESLKKKGFKVIIGKRDTRANRVKEKKEVKPDYYISIHCNSNKNKNAHGEEVFYRKKDDKAFAEALNKQLASDNTIKKNRGANQANYQVLNHDPAKTKSALVELAFISNDSDRAKLLDPETLTQQVEQIAKGLVEYDNAQ